MSDYGSVNSKPANTNYDPNSAFADAVQRARQIAAKIHTGSSGGSGDSNNLNVGQKRSLEENGAPESKKLAPMNDPFGAQLAAMQQQRAGEPGPTPVMAEDWTVPDKMVGLIIGRGGEQIVRIQSESGCKIQLALESSGAPDRPCTLTGTKQAIEKVKELIGQIVNRGGPQATPADPAFAPEGQTVVEMMIPGGKVGLVIGKGGETIRNLQERAGVKMVMIQDGPQQTVGEKPLRITGEAQKCEFAKQMVLDLITEKELEAGTGRGRGRGRGFNAQQDNRQDYGGPAGPGTGRGRGAGGSGDPAGQEVQYSVPANKCGLVIGKGGETIRSINQQTGAHVELSRAPPPTPHEKIFIIRGNPQQIEHAQQLISERIGAPPAQNGPPPYPTQYPQPYGYNQQPPPPAQPYAPQGWGNAYQHWQNQTAAPNDPTKAAADANAAAWAAYYAQYYGQAQPPQQQPPQQQPPPPQQPVQPPNQTGYYGQAQPPQQQPPQQQPPPPQQPGQPPNQTAAPAATVVTTATTVSAPQPDYSAAWAEYYRSLGMFREAEMIEQQARANQQAAHPQPYQPPQQYQPPAQGASPVPPTTQQPQVVQGQIPVQGAPPQQPQVVPAPQPAPAPAPPAPAAPAPTPTPAPAPPAPAPAPAPTPAPAQNQQFPPGAAPPAPGQWPHGSYSPQQQNPYQQQQNPYPGYGCAAYGAQQYPGTSQ